MGLVFSNSFSWISLPITQTLRLYWTSCGIRNLPYSGRALDTRIYLSVVPTTVTASIRLARYLISRWVKLDGFTAFASLRRAASFCASFRVRFSRLRYSKKLPVMIQGMRVTYRTSEPTAEMLSLKEFCNPFAAVMVVTTATIPMMIPRVVSTPRALLALIAARAMRNDSLSSYRYLMPFLFS